ncbi:MAG: DUF4956 domain-containing protein [Clostridia bacterium]|nr:DUF4956 domain-containing protein [Clostridia bacterium]
MNILNSILTTPITATGLLICLGCALLLGVLSALVFSYKSRNSASLSITLALLPMAMAMVVMMVNGNLGVAIAVAGGFTLVRFRSIAGTGREICAVFINMTLGVITGMGYIGIAAIFFVLVAAANIVLVSIGFGGRKKEKLLRITIPEDYDYAGLFDDIFKKNNITAGIHKIKTTNMGSLIDVTYRITLEGETVSKEMIDEIRQRNGNLGVMVSTFAEEREQL